MSDHRIMIGRSLCRNFAHHCMCPTFFPISSTTLLIQLKGETASWNSVPESCKHPDSAASYLVMMASDRHTVSQTMRSKDMKNRRGPTTLYLGMCLAVQGESLLSLPISSVVSQLSSLSQVGFHCSLTVSEGLLGVIAISVLQKWLLLHLGQPALACTVLLKLSKQILWQLQSVFKYYSWPIVNGIGNTYENFRRILATFLQMV